MAIGSSIPPTENSRKKADPRFTGSRPDFTDQLTYYHDRLRSLGIVTRALIEGEQAKKELAMSGGKTLIKGLSEAVAAAKASIAEARQAPVELLAATTELKATCADLTSQVKAMHEDIKFEATQLGNGAPASEPKSNE